ncbi:MAG: hypothetical protein VST70_09330 [Nitrospirota bacterium]|nr:hypothetical protein [Nitrospirota bacterium]
MRRSFWFTAVLTVALGVWVPGRTVPARAENPNLISPSESPGEILSGKVNSAPFTETGVPGQGNLPARTSRPSVSPLPQGAGSPGPPEEANGHRSLGSLFELKRQETLLKREIAIKKLKDQLKGSPAKKILDTGTRGSPVTLLAAGVEGRRYAVLSWPDGRLIRVRQGEILPDGSRVFRIDGSGVSVEKRGKTVTYPFGESSGGGASGGTPRFPGFSPPPTPYPMTGGSP